MQLSVIIPAYNEGEGQRESVVASVSVLEPVMHFESPR